MKDEKPRRRNRSRLLQQILGWTLVIIGIPLYPMPIPLGLVCIVAGLVLLARNSAWVRRRLGALRRWAPRLYDKLVAARDEGQGESLESR